MREWLGERSCMSSSFPVAVLGGALFICICNNEVLFSYLSMEDGWFVIFQIFKSFCFLSIEFRYSFSISYKILLYFAYFIVVWVRCDRPSGLLLFVPALLLSIITPLFLPSSSVSLSYFVLAVPMRECLGGHSCMSSPCPIAILYGTFLFSRIEIVCDLGRSFVYQNQIKLN